jgi:quercetin dioxygenase-like cupin family protein
MEQVRINVSDLPTLTLPGRGALAGRCLLEGRRFGLDHLSLTLGESAPGQGTRLHRHDCEELIIVHSGRGMYTVGDTTIEAGCGDIVIIPSGTPHRWVNHTLTPLIHTGVFSANTFSLEILD